MTALRVAALLSLAIASGCATDDRPLNEPDPLAIIHDPPPCTVAELHRSLKDMLAAYESGRHDAERYTRALAVELSCWRDDLHGRIEAPRGSGTISADEIEEGK